MSYDLERVFASHRIPRSFRGIFVPGNERFLRTAEYNKAVKSLKMFAGAPSELFESPKIISEEVSRVASNIGCLVTVGHLYLDRRVHNIDVDHRVLTLGRSIKGNGKRVLGVDVYDNDVICTYGMVTRNDNIKPIYIAQLPTDANSRPEDCYVRDEQNDEYFKPLCEDLGDQRKRDFFIDTVKFMAKLACTGEA